MTVLIHHQTFGYFTGLGWTANKAEAKRLDPDVAKGWKKLMCEIAETDDSVGFSPRAVTFIFEPNAEAVVGSTPLPRHRDHRIDPPVWFR